jgi:hypothetical protein
VGFCGCLFSIKDIYIYIVYILYILYMYIYIYDSGIYSDVPGYLTIVMEYPGIYNYNITQDIAVIGFTVDLRSP